MDALLLYAQEAEAALVPGQDSPGARSPGAGPAPHLANDEGDAIEPGVAAAPGAEPEPARDTETPAAALAPSPQRGNGAASDLMDVETAVAPASASVSPVPAAAAEAVYAEPAAAGADMGSPASEERPNEERLPAHEPPVDEPAAVQDEDQPAPLPSPSEDAVDSDTREPSADAAPAAEDQSAASSASPLAAPQLNDALSVKLDHPRRSTAPAR
jgi:nicotinate-nucleotide--dimethylbenzimidazole phosphoribosyltransferase